MNAGRRTANLFRIDAIGRSTQEKKSSSYQDKDTGLSKTRILASES